ncbi:hypothetical protein I4U23_002370 [Adineta vaga]|nr:hypothetical protein I4U23_002370 [Adineta vaga]
MAEALLQHKKAALKRDRTYILRPKMRRSGDTKYFCVRMLRKILPDYPEDIIRRSYQYQYRKTIDLYSVTACEVGLLNRINSHHSRWAFSRHPFTALDEIVRVSDFYPYYEHLRSLKSPPVISNATIHTLRQLLPQPTPQQNVQRASNPMINRPSIIQRQTTIPQASPIQIQQYPPPSTNFSRETTSTNSRPTSSATNGRQPKSIGNPYAVVLPTRLPQVVTPVPTQIQQATPTSSSFSINAINFSNSVPTINVAPIPSTTSASVLPTTSISSSSSTTSSSSPPVIPSSIHYSPSSSSSPILPSTTPTVNGIVSQKPSTTSSTVSPVLLPSSTPSSTITVTTPATTSSSKPTRLHCGWLQVNKLYTPYISTSTTNHHLFKLPVSLLTFYDLLKLPSMEANDIKTETLLPCEQIPASTQELELINELCVKQHIKPFGPETRLIQLSTFYQYTTATMVFVKELPNEEPKSSICKEWTSIVQMNGGICRLRNITTLHEQTVPFIGNSLVKSFVLSTHCLSAASLTKPTSSELEFLQLILFFSNICINLRNAQLIDIESVKKEYNVDLILLFNDKFPLNVLNYQQSNRLNPSQGGIIPTNPAPPTNTIAESTPPPSPPSSPTNQPPSNNTSQLPLTSSPNRFYKTIQFHGHTMTAYVCSGLGSNTQRECVSIRSLCNILFPDSPSLDKLEMKMLRLLRLKNINRFRPQNQQSLGFTRLIDIKDAEKHWNFLEQEMHALFNGKLIFQDEFLPKTYPVIDNQEANNRPSLSTVSNDNTEASTVVERVENEEQSSTEPTLETNKGEKRPLEEPLDEEDMPVLERINKRVRFAEKENNKTLADSLNNSISSLTNGKTKSDDNSTDKTTKKRTIKLTSAKLMRKRPLPSNRINRESKAKWTKKFDIEDCCILLNQCDANLITERD